MLVSRSCSFCHEMNLATERYCRACGHEAHVARLDCRCPRCNRARRLATGTDTPVPLAGVIAATLAALRPGADPTANTEERTTMTADHENATGTTPPKRTPVPPDLAEKIRVLDEALLAAFGFDLCYTIWARDGLIAGSNAREGYVPPVVAPTAPEETT